MKNNNKKEDLLEKISKTKSIIEQNDDFEDAPEWKQLQRDISVYSDDAVKNYVNVLEILSRSTDDFLFLLDIKRDENLFFGDVDRNYSLHSEGKITNTIAEMLEIVHPCDRDAVAQDLKEISEGRKNVHNMDYRWINRRGQVVWINCRGKVISDGNGNPYVMIGRVSESTLKHLYNPLTGLFNKNKMMSDLKAESSLMDHGYFMLVDIDDLTVINLSHGRKYGDDLLKNLANELESIPYVKKIYHLEQQYFGVFLDVASEQDVQCIYSQIQQAMLDKCLLSAGVVPMDNNVFFNENNLYDSAKIILKNAKSRGKNVLKIFSDEEIKHKVYSVELLEELQESVRNDYEGFYINYQPQLKAGNYDIYSIEALIRYKSKSGKNVFPDEFIPLLEQSRLIDQVGLWILENSLIQCRKWRKHIKDLRISVNFSTVQFRDKYVIDNVLGVLKKTDMPGDVLTIEITESIPLNEINHFSNIIRCFKAEGIQIAIDDFGTGYSNIGYLKQLDVDEIKIDRMFVKGIEEDTYNYKVISNILEFAKMNSIRVCCEGVENVRELAVLESLSPDIVQGYLFDKPCEPWYFEQGYIDSESERYRKRAEFTCGLYQYKEKMGIISFNPKDILRETNVGLWVIRISEENQ